MRGRALGEERLKKQQDGPRNCAFVAVFRAWTNQSRSKTTKKDDNFTSTIEVTFLNPYNSYALRQSKENGGDVDKCESAPGNEDLCLRRRGRRGA